VVATAPMVPTGIDLEASARSPDLLDPAIIPAVAANIKVIWVTGALTNVTWLMLGYNVISTVDIKFFN